VTNKSTAVNQCSKPTGWWGRVTLWRMNASHSKLTDWGLTHVSIGTGCTILDIGCGGGRTVDKLAAVATQGKVYGVDYSDESVEATKRTNARWIDLGRVEIRNASVSQLPFPADTFDLATAVETHFWWSSLTNDIREVFRVIKPGGTLLIIAEVYKGANTMVSKLSEKYAPKTGMTLLSPDEHRELLESSGFSDVHVFEERVKGWISATGRKPIPEF
jgi:ubiquinone/menaquinone biosynthesis C-methylase UbiE